MIHQELDAANVENVGLFDRVNRLVLALAAVTLAVTFTPMPEPAIVSLTGIGIYAGLTAFVGWDPLYALARALHGPTPTPSPKNAVAATGQHRAAQASPEEYKRAA